MSGSTTNLDLISSSQAAKEVTANALFDAESPAALYGRRASTTANLTWGYYGGYLSITGIPTAIPNGTKTLTNGATNYITAERSTGNVAVSTSNTSWNDTANHARLYSVVTAGNLVTSYTDVRSFALGENGTTIYAQLAGNASQAFSTAGLTTTGLLDLSNSGAGQIKFPATQNPSADANTLDDYEEGTFTPILRDAPTGNAATTSASIGRYVKVGVWVNTYVALININTSGLVSGSQIFVTAYPFAAANVANHYPIALVGKSAITTTAGVLTAALGPNLTYAALTNETTTGATIAAVSQITSGSGDIYTSIGYENQ